MANLTRQDLKSWPAIIAIYQTETSEDGAIDLHILCHELCLEEGTGSHGPDTDPTIPESLILIFNSFQPEAQVLSPNAQAITCMMVTPTATWSSSEETTSEA